MQGSDPFGMILALALIFAAVTVGALLLWLYDQLKRITGLSHDLDRCLTCGKTLYYEAVSGTYRRHRCRPSR